MIEKQSIELDLNFFNLLETTYYVLRAYVLWIYIKLLKTFKIFYVLNLVHILICNVKARINNNKTQRRSLLEWISTKVKEPLFPTNFNEDWKDGILLCALVEGVVPGSCPRYDLLNSDQPIDNLNLGLSLIKKYLNIESPIESHEIHDCTEEAKLVYLISRIKFESMKIFMKSLLKRSIIQVKDSLGNSHKIFESLYGDQRACFAKGMGLILGVRTRRARFNIFCRPVPKLNLMIEIRGPNNTMCSERITVHSPKKRVSADVVTASLIHEVLNRKKSFDGVLKIPFFYEMFPNRIVVTYIPLMKGIHKLSIVWQGQHIMNSPYTVDVEDSESDNSRRLSISNPISPTKFMPGLQYPVNAAMKTDSFSFDECATVVGRKILKQTVVINGEQQVMSENKDTNESKKVINNSIKDSMDYIPKPHNLINNENDLINSSQFDFDDKIQLYIPKISTHSEKLNRLRINEMNKNIDLFDIKECDSVESEKYFGSNAPNEEKNSQKILSKDNIDIQNNKFIELEKEQLSTNTKNKYELSESLHKNNSLVINDFNDESSVKLSSKPQSFTKSTNYKNQTLIKYSPIRTYAPVKNMIQSWETKITNISENNTQKNFEKNKFEKKIEFIPIKNRLKIFETNETQDLTLNNKNNVLNHSKEEQMNELNDFNTEEEKLNSSQNYINELIADECNQKPNGLSEEIGDQSLEINANKPESHPDSGCDSQPSTNKSANNELTQVNIMRRKSLSCSDIKSFENDNKNESKYFDILDKNENNINNTRTSSLSGQYIDDEIPDYSTLYLGEYTSYTGLLNTERPIAFNSDKFDNFNDCDNNQNSNDKNPNFAPDLSINPEKCEVFGAGVYYGQVGIKNNFVVSTKDGGKSFLTVGVQSSGQNDVIEVSFASIGKDTYEVQYEVSQPGYYIIFVKWGDYNIGDSPYICKVTY